MIKKLVLHAMVEAKADTRVTCQEHAGEVTTEPSKFQYRNGCTGEGELNFDAPSKQG